MEVIEKLVFAYAITFRRGDDTDERTISFEHKYGSAEDVDTDAVANFGALLVGKYKNLIQPTGWRDDDATEAEWTAVKVLPKITYTSATDLAEVTPA